MSADFRTRQLRVSQIVNSGSATTTPLLIYGLGSATNDSGGFDASHFITGSDTWLFISGTSGAKNSTSRGVVAFKGDVVISGTIYNSAGAAYSTGGGGTPGGSNTQVQFNADGVFAATSGLTFATGSSSLTISGDLAVNGGDLTTTSTGIATLFNTNATTVNIAGGATSGTTVGNATGGVTLQGSATVAGSLQVNGNAIKASGGATALTLTNGNLTGSNLQLTGDLAVNGGDITTSASTFNIASSATTLNLGSSAGKVVVPGDFEVQGTTVTVDVTNITIEDPLIGLGFTTGSVAGSAGDRGFIGGITGAGNNVAFAWSNNSSSFVATKTTSTAGSTSIVVGGLQPIRASSFQVNGTTAVVTSSDGTTLLMSGTSVVLDSSAAKPITFREDGSRYIEFSKSAGYSAQVRAIEDLYPSLYLSGAQVHIDSYDGNTWYDKNSNGFMLIDSTTATSPKIYARRGDGLAYDLTLSGADLFLGSNNGRVSTLRGATEYLRSSYNGASDVVFSAQSFNFSVGSTASTQVSGSSVVLNHGAGAVNLQRHGTQFLTISSGSGDLASIVASAGKQFQVGGTGLTKLSGSLIAISAGATGIGFEVSNVNFLNILAQSANTVLSSSNQLILRPTTGITQVTGSLIAPTITGSLRKTAGNLDFITGSGVTVNYNSSGQWELTSSATPGGSTKQVQFNDGGTLGGDAEFTYDKTANLLTLTGSLINGNNAVASGIYSHAEGDFTTASGQYAHSEGQTTTASGNYSHAEGYDATASGTWSHAEGGHTTAGPGNASHAEGWYSVASGGASHAEGQFATASGGYAHAEGNTTTASGQDSHAEGYQTTAAGTASHAEGYLTVTRGTYSHAAGIGTIASGSGQSVVGSYNKRNNNSSLFVIGDGTGDADANRGDIVRVNSGSSIGRGNVQITGSLIVSSSITGSLTKLIDGSDYLRAGSNVTLTTGSDGSVTIASTGGGGGGTPAGSNSYLQFNADGSFGGVSNLTFTTSSNTLNLNGYLDTQALDSRWYLRNNSADALSFWDGSGGSRRFQVNMGDAQERFIAYDNAGFAAGDSSDLVILHDGADSYIKNNTGRLIISGANSVILTGSVYSLNNVTIAGDLAVDGGDITTTSSTATIFSTNVSSLSLANVASTFTVGGSSSSTSFTFNVAANRTGNSTLNLGTGATSTGNTKNVNIGQGGDPGSTTNVRIGTTDTNAATNIYMSGSVYVTGSVGLKGSIVPDATSTYTLGTDALRWAHVYTGDLHLRNERGDWTIIEENDFLRIVNNKTGKSFKMLMQPLD